MKGILSTNKKDTISEERVPLACSRKSTKATVVRVNRRVARNGMRKADTAMI